MSIYDITTINVTPGSQLEAPARKVQASLTGLANQINANIPLVNASDPAIQANAQDQGDALTRQLLIETTSNLGSEFILRSDALAKNTATGLLIHGYTNSARFIATTTTFETDLKTSRNTIQIGFDILRNPHQSLTYPGQNQQLELGYRTVVGITDSIIEGQILQEITGPTGLKTTSAYDTINSALISGIPLVFLDQTNINTLDAMNLSAEAKARITRAVDGGHIVIVPRDMVSAGGKTTTAWFELDQTSGSMIAVSENGQHSAIVENKGLLGGLAVLLSQVTKSSVQFVYSFTYNFVIKYATNQFLSARTLIHLIDLQANFLVRLRTEFAIAGLSPQIRALALRAAFRAAKDAFEVVKRFRKFDPVVGSFLASPPPSIEFANLGSGVTGGLALGIIPDPFLTIPVGGGQVPTAFVVGIHNSGITDETVSLSVTPPAGFTSMTSVPTIRIPAGQTAEVGLCLTPTGEIPAQGSTISFGVTATSTTNPAMTQAQTVTFTIPAIDAVTISDNLTSLNTTPGTPVTDTVTITNAGNVPENNVALTATLPTGLTLTGLSPVSLLPGQSITQTVTITPAPSTPLNSHLSATITATYGPSASPLTQTLTIPVGVVVPGADAIANAAAAAGKLGNGNLAARLNDLSTALTTLVQAPADPVAKSQTLASLAAVTGLLNADPFLAASAGALAGARAAIVAAATPADLLAAANTLGSALTTLGTTLADESTTNFTLALVNNSQVAQPLSPATFQLVLQNTGTRTTTYDLSVSGLPAGVTASLSQNKVTLKPGEVTPGTAGVPDVTVSLTNPSTTDLSPFSFQITATAKGAPEITQSTTGSLTTRAALVQVVSVTANPTFTDPGGKVDVSARVLNAVNKEQSAEVSYKVSDPTGKVIFTSTPVSIALHVLTTLTTLDLGNLDTTGYAIGDDTITVTLTDPSGHPILGATGTGSLLIGTPVTATLSTSPSTLPPGSGTVTTTLQLNGQTSSAAALNLAGQAAVSGASGVAVDGNLAYVGTSNAIEVVNISDPTKPVVLSTFGLGDFPAGAVVQMQVYNNELVVLASQFAGISNLLVYSLATPASPTLLGKTPLTLSGGNDQGIGLTSISNNHVYTGSFAYRYFLGSGQIFAQFGESLDVDITDPTHPAVVNVIYNDPPSPTTVYPDGNSGYPDGTSNVGQSAPADATTLLIGTTTATMGTTNGPGVKGLVMVVDTTDPSNPSVLEKLAIPGMAVVTGIVV